MEREMIARTSKRFASACVWLGVAAVSAVALYWTTAKPASVGILWLTGVAQPTELSLKTRCLAFLVTLIPTLPVLAGLRYLHRLFSLYAQSMIFQDDNVAALRGVALSSIAFAVAHLVFHPLLAIVLTMNNPPGQHVVTFALSSGGVAAAIFGGLLWVIGRVMDEARKINEEQSWTV